VQRGTVHFEYMMTVGGGFLRTASSLEEHIKTLAELVRHDPYERNERSARFVQAFVRPRGLDVPPATVFTKAMLQLLRAPSELRLPSPLGRTIGRLIHRAAPLLGAPLEDGTLGRWALRWQAFLTKLVTSWRAFLTRLITSLRKRLVKPLRKRLVTPLDKMLVRQRKRARARLKPIRRFFLVQLRAAVRALLLRLAPQRRPTKSPQAKSSERQH
jgi:hypothetical protein